MSVLDGFSEPVRAWFSTNFEEPTDAQRRSWPEIAAGHHTLLCAPTGSGKTLAAFLWAIDRMATGGSAAGSGVRVVYVSPLRALAVDVEKNLRGPIRGAALAAERLGVPFRTPSVGVRTGDTSARERRRLVRRPPEILITTPESLYLMLTSSARDSLCGVETVIVDEIHALAPTKRGTHLALTLERLDRWLADHGAPPVQRVGLSATQRPLERIGHFLVGNEVEGDAVRPRPCRIVDAGIRKELDVQVVVPPDDGAPSIWPQIHPRLLELIEQHRSTLVFVNARRLSERLAARLNELAHTGVSAGGEAVGSSLPDGVTELVKAHHGSLSRERRLVIEDELKRGELRGLVATSSLELGIDMGAVDLVIQVESPGSVARGLQRIGRAGHQVGVPSRGRIFPKHRADLLEAAVVVRGMAEGLVEETRVPVAPLDVLAQQLVALCALEDWSVDELEHLVRGAAPYATLSRALLEEVLDLLSGRYPAEEFAELRPRLVWDRTEGRVRGRSGAQRLAVTNAGVIPDRGLFGVFLADGTRVGELDEEMVYESRVGETFLLGASTWRIEDITSDRVVVSPAPGRPGRMPFWRGEGPGRPVELGRALGAVTRELRGLPQDRALEWLRSDFALDEVAATTLVGYLAEQAEATGAVPDDRTIVVERFRDEIGDWRVCIHTPFGAQVHAPWAIALRARLEADAVPEFAGWSTGVEVLWSDDGIVVRLPESDDRIDVESLIFQPEEVEEAVIAALPSTALFAGRFRESAARALLLPRRRPDRRTPLWQQRQRAADLLAVASRYPSFPLLLEATRELCNDHFDLPALRSLMADIRTRRVRTVSVETRAASPFAASLLFGWIAVYMYEGDAPLAERRAAALSLDRELLRDLLGVEELRTLLDPEALDEVEADLQHLADGRRARDHDELHDLLRVLGPLSLDDLAARATPPTSVPTEAGATDVGTTEVVAHWVETLIGERRAFEAGVAGERRVVAVEDAARVRDALGVALPPGLPAVFTEPGPTPLADLVARYARTHGPFTTAELAARWAIAPDPVAVVLQRLADTGVVVRGEFRPEGRGQEWCDAGVLRRVRRASLARLRAEVEPVDSAALARFLPAWQGVGESRRGVDALAEVVGQLQGVPLPASLLEADLLAPRVTGYRSADLDQLVTSGEVVWIGAGGLGAHDGRVRLCFRDQVATLLSPPDPAARPADPIHEVIRGTLEARGASFWPELVAAVVAAGLPNDDATVLEALWDLVWAGEVTNDGVAPLRARVAAGTSRSASGARSRTRSRRPLVSRATRLGPPAAAGRWSGTAPLFEGAPPPTEVAMARAMQLLDRYGLVARETALAEGLEGGFAGVYPVLGALEERGRVRRGYFVAGLGAAQFALPGAVDRLRAGRYQADDELMDPADAGPPVVLAAVDPANPFGAAVPWPESSGSPARAVGAYVVVDDGRLLAYLERGGRRVLTFEDGRTEAARSRWAAALAGLVTSARVRRLELREVDGVPVAVAPAAPDLLAAGFADGYKGFTIRAGLPGATPALGRGGPSR